MCFRYRLARYYDETEPAKLELCALLSGKIQFKNYTRFLDRLAYYTFMICFNLFISMTADTPIRNLCANGSIDCLVHYNNSHHG